MIDFKKYSQICKDKKIVNPYRNESDFNRAYGIDNSVHIEPLRIAPKKPTIKQSLTVEKLAEPKKVSSPKQKTVKQQKPKAPPKKKADRVQRVKKTPEELREAKRERQRNWYRKTVGKEVKPHAIPRTSLIGMTEEEKRAHKAKLKKMREQRLIDAGLPIRKNTPEIREYRRKYWASYYEQRKNDPDYIAKRAKWDANRKARRILEVNSVA